MEGSTVRPLGPKSNGVRVFTQPEAVRAYLQQRKIIVHDSSSPFTEDDPSLPQPGKIRKSRKIKNYVHRIMPHHNMSLSASEHAYGRLRASEPNIPAPQGYTSETRSNDLQDKVLSSLRSIPDGPSRHNLVPRSNETQGSVPSASRFTSCGPPGYSFGTCSNKTQTTVPLNLRFPSMNPPRNFFETCPSETRTRDVGVPGFTITSPLSCPSETRSNSAQGKTPTPVGNAIRLPDDLEYVLLQPLEGEVKVEHLPMSATPSTSTLEALETPSQDKKTGMMLPLVLESPQLPPYDCFQPYDLAVDFDSALNEEDIRVATDFFSSHQDELILTLDDVMNSVLTEISDSIEEIKTLLLEPRTQETIGKINKVMASKQQLTSTFQRILFTYSVRQDKFKADPMMSS